MYIKSDRTKVLRFWNVMRNFQSVCVWLSRRTSHYPTQNYFPFIPFLLFMHLSECLWFCLQDTFYFPPIVVNRLLYLFLFLHGIISIVFKIGSTVLQCTIYDPILEAILIPECTYFTCKTLKLFIFDTKTSKTAYCIIFWSL